MEWDTVIGLEVHAQLRTQSKLFSAAATAFGAEANAHTHFIDAGLPGVLPVLNEAAVQLAVRFGLAIHAEINDLSSFERKNYFYPDLPKGYQISQFQRPILSHGHLNIETSHGDIKKVEIVRAHLEEDAGKSIHDAMAGFSGIDLNRAGIPLLEIVTSPCLSSAHEAIAYLKKLHQLLRFLDVCDGNMQEGSFRCDVNISLKAKGSDILGTRTELKNLNSFRFIEQAIAYEQSRQQDLLEAGKSVDQETRLFSPETGKTQLMRRKEEENDYRYFPDPDLLPVKITAELIEKEKNAMPPLPETIENSLLTIEGLLEEDRLFLLSSAKLYQFFTELCTKTAASEKMVINWMKGPLSNALKSSELSLEESPVSLESIAVLLDAMEKQRLSHHQAKSIFSKIWAKEAALDDLLLATTEAKLSQESSLKVWVEAVINEYPEQVAEYKAGKEKLLGFFVGQVMKKSQGKADPASISQYLIDCLN